MKRSPATASVVAGSILAAAVAVGAPTVAGAEASQTIARTTPESDRETLYCKWKGFSLDGKS